MRSYQDSYIHEVPITTIQTILEKGAWQVPGQSITSAITNDNDQKEPDAVIVDNTSGINAFYDIKFDSDVKRVLDVGGGKFDVNQHYMKHERNIDLLVWDPYNRSQLHNDTIRSQVEDSKVDSVTSMSVLNVIPEVLVRLAHLCTLKSALKISGKVFIKIWPGEPPFQGSYLNTATETCYQANAYADRFLREIEIVFGIGNVKLDLHVPNLIVAVKVNDSPTSSLEIARIQEYSTSEGQVLKKIKEKSVDNLYAKTDILKLFSTNAAFFKKMEISFLEKNRHSNSKLQQEYDKRLGVVKRN